MAKAIISSILESQLGKYVDGLSGDSLQVGLWSGELTLTNLSLKPHALAELQLPITVVKGSIRRIHVVVPWNQLGSASVQVAIEGVYALVVPNPRLPTPEELRLAKRGQVERQELLRQHDRLAASHNPHGEDEGTFLSRLTERIIDNLQITLRDIHFRYEDAASNPESPFACGIMIQSFAFQTTDAEGHETFVDRAATGARFLHKAISLAHACVYWDRLAPGDTAALIQHRSHVEPAMAEMVHAMCQKATAAVGNRDGKRLWIVRPCSLTVHLTKNETNDYSVVAKHTITADLKGLSIALSREQYEDMLFLDRAFASRKMVETRFLHAKCRPLHRPTKFPREWWDYALRLVLTRRVRQTSLATVPTPRFMRVRLRYSTVKRVNIERRLYMEAFRMQLRKGSALEPTTKEARRLEEYEITYPIDVIMNLRDVAEDQEVMAKEQQQIEKASVATQAATSNSGSWYNYFFGSTESPHSVTVAPSTASTSSAENVLSVEGRANLKKAYDESVEKEKALSVPTDCNLFSVKFQLKGGQLALYQSRCATPFLVGTLHGSLAIDVRPTYDWDARFRVDTFQILNGLAVDTAFHEFCSLGNWKSAQANQTDAGTPNVTLDVSQKSLICSSDEDTANSVRVRLHMMPVRFMVDPSFIMFLQRFFGSMLPEQQLEKVWSFATSSVSEWIFSDDEDAKLYESTITSSRPLTEFDILVDMNAPVIVLPEGIRDERSSVVVIDFGRFQFQNEIPPKGDRDTRKRLYWSTQLTHINVTVGEVNGLPTADCVRTMGNGFDNLIQDFNANFTIDSIVAEPTKSTNVVHSPTVPNIAATALIPGVVFSLSQDQLLRTARIFASIRAQYLQSSCSTSDTDLGTHQSPIVVDGFASLEPRQSPPHKSRNNFKDVFALKISLVIGEIVVHIREQDQTDAFRLCLERTSFDLTIFSSRTVVQARLQSLIMEDCLYNADSRFFKLISTGSSLSTINKNLISLDVTMFTGNEDESAHVVNADTVVDLRASVLDIQWNPSSVALMYQLWSSVAAIIDNGCSSANSTPNQQSNDTSVPTSVLNVTTNQTIPPMIFKASLVRLSVTFNKNELDRQLVRLGIEDVSIEYTQTPGKIAANGFTVRGILGNLVATDLSLNKHALYSPLLGLSAPDGEARKESSSAHPLLVFTHSFGGDPVKTSSLKLEFESIRAVYFHQQLMELVDYLFEGILGAMVSQTLATATQILLAEADASVIFSIVAKEPTLILPVRLADPYHVRLTAEFLSLEHFPSSSVAYCGDGPLRNRDRIVQVSAAVDSPVEESDNEIRFRADCKRVKLDNVRVAIARSMGSSVGQVDTGYEDILVTPTQLVVKVEDIIAAPTYSEESRYLPRFTISFLMNELNVRLHRSHYLSMLQLVQDNFGAEQLFTTSREQITATSEPFESSRPTVEYSYSRTDLEAVTMQLGFEMNSLRCVLISSQNPRSLEGIDKFVNHSGEESEVVVEQACFVATNFSAKLNQLWKSWPEICVHLGSLALQDRATSSLRRREPTQLSDPIPGVDGQLGVVFYSKNSTDVVYAWDEQVKQCRLSLATEELHGIVIPEFLLMLTDFFSLPVERDYPQLCTSDQELSARDTDNQAYQMAVELKARGMVLSVPQDVYDIDCEQISLRTDVTLMYSWKPPNLNTDVSANSADLDIQSNLLVDATGIEVVIRNAQRQGCVPVTDLISGVLGTSTSSGVQIIEPCQIHVEMSNLFPHANQQQQIVLVKVSPVEVFLSYDDVCIMSEILASMNRSSSRRVAAESVESTLSAKAFAAPSTEQKTLETHRYFTCELGAMSLTLINDCDGCDMGLVQFQTQTSNSFLNVTMTPTIAPSKHSMNLSGSGGLVTLISYYNPDTRDWHPMCSEWSVDVSVQGSIVTTNPDETNENELHIIISATHPLDIVVTHGLLEVVASAAGAWNRRATSAISLPSTGSTSADLLSGTENRKKAPCVIRNDTGLPIVFWLTGLDSSSGKSPHQIIPSGHIADLHYVHSAGRGCGAVRKYTSRERSPEMRLNLSLQDTLFRPIEDIDFELLGSRAFPLVDERGGRTQFTLNCHARLVEGRIVLAMSSQMKLVSKLSIPIQLIVNDPTWVSPVEIGVLYPHQESAIPVLASLGTELRVRPFADAVYNWSAPIPVQTRSSVELKVESTSSYAKNALFCVSMTMEQSLRVVCFADPVTIVNKLPVEFEYRVKSPLIAGTSNAGTKTEAVRVGVGARSGIWWCDSQQRPLFKIGINGCQSSKWMELVSSKTKNGEIFSAMVLRHDGRPLKLLIQVVEHPAKSVHIFLYAEVWFINRTGLDLVFGNEVDSEAYFPPLSARSLVGNAQICAYSSSSDAASSAPPVVRLSMPSCGWSSRFTADPRRMSWQDECLTLRSDRRSEAGSNVLYEFGVSADYSTRHFGSITTLVSIIPRYLILNRSSHTILILESSGNDAVRHNENEAHHILAKGDTYAFYWVRGIRSKIRVSVIGDVSDYGWSDSISLDQFQTTTLVIPSLAHGRYRSPNKYARLLVSIKQGGISQSSIVVSLTEATEEDAIVSGTSSISSISHVGWRSFTVHTQLAGLVVTVADNNLKDGGDLFIAQASGDENVARLTITRVTAELSVTRNDTSAKLMISGVSVEDLLPNSKQPVVLRPVTRNDSFSGRSAMERSEKCFLEISYLERPHTKYRWIERIRMDVQDVRVATTMRFVDRLNDLMKETVSHFESCSYSTSSGEGVAALADAEADENILEYFVLSGGEDDSSMASITGQKVYIESCEIAPVRVVVSFSREKGDVRNDPNAGFWLSSLKFKIENAYLTLDSYKISHALATQEALLESLGVFYVKSVKSQALGLIDSIQVTSLVTSAVTSGVSSLVSTIIGKTDPTLSTETKFRYQFQTNNQIISKHSKILSGCESMSQFLHQIKHLVYDWDSNHTGLEARGCVAIGIINNSRHSLVINAHLNDGAEMHILPAGRRHLGSVADSLPGAGNDWRSDRIMVIFAWGYTPTLLTSGDVYFTIQSNACNVYVTRKMARLVPNIGYTAVFTHQEVQSWWTTNVIIVGDDLHGHTATGATASTPVDTNLFGGVSSGMIANTPAPSQQAPVRMQSSERDIVDDEYEVVFTSKSLGLIAKQSDRNVIVRECLPLENGLPGPAMASGKIAAGDTIITVNGMKVTNTTQFRDLVASSPRPLVLRFRRTGDRFNSNSAFDLFGEKSNSDNNGGGTSSSHRAQPSTEGQDYDLFGTRSSK